MLPDLEQRVVGGGLWGADLLIFESLDSTNAWALTHSADLKHGDVVRAIRQHAGKGRFERTWVSPGRCGLTLSTIVNPATPTDVPDPLLLSIAAISVRDTLAEFGVATLLKWPNDVMTPRGKIAGILAAKDATSNAIVLGIGINVNMTAPAIAGMNFEQTPTSMAVERERLFDIALVCRRLLVHIEKDIDVARLNGSASIAKRWSEADYLEGKEITINGPGGRTTGRYGGTRESGQLRLLEENGREHLFWSGDVSISYP